MHPDDVTLAVVTGHLERLLAALPAAASIAEKRYLLDALAEAIVLADPGRVDRELRQRAEVVGIDVEALGVEVMAAPPHAVTVPMVVRGADGVATWRHGDGEPIAFVRQFYVTAAARHDGAALSLDASARQSVAAAIALAASSLGRDRGSHDLVAAQPAALAALPVEGASLSAAAFASAMSLWSHRPMRAACAITGAVGLRRGAPGPMGGQGDRQGGQQASPTVAPIEGVGDIEAKVLAAAAARCQRIIVPQRDAAAAQAVARRDESSIEVVGVATTAQLLDAALEKRPTAPLSPDRAVGRAMGDFRGGWQTWRWPGMVEQLSRLATELPATRADLTVTVATMRGAVARHLGSPEDSLALLTEAQARADSPLGRRSVPDHVLGLLHRHLSLTHRQLCRFDEASAAARRAVEIADRARLRGDLIKALGCAGIVAMSTLEPTRAAALLGRALEVAHEHDPTTAPRTSAYLIDALGMVARAGSPSALEEARRIHSRAQAELDRQNKAASDPAWAWLRIAMGGALLANGLLGEARAVLRHPAIEYAIDHQPLPGLLARRSLGLTLIAHGAHPAEVERGYGLLATSKVAFGVAARGHVGFLAGINILSEIWARICRGELDDDASARGLAALEAFPRSGAASTFFAASRRRVRTQLLELAGRRRRRRAPPGSQVLQRPRDPLELAAAMAVEQMIADAVRIA